LVSYFSRLAQPFSSYCSKSVGPGFRILTSDRYSAYNWLAVSQRQVCWAHLKRDFTQIAERAGHRQKWVAPCWSRRPVCLVVSSPRWHLVRRDLSGAVAPIRSRVHELLTNEIGTRRKRPGQKTVRTCRQLLQVEPALWLFVTTVGVRAHQQCRRTSHSSAVLWRRTSFGSQSQAGSLFVARMLR